MKIDYAKVDDVNGLITISVEESDYAEKVKKQIKEIGKRRPEPGFRPGHVPAGLLEKKYGAAVRYDVINEVVSDALFNYIKENNLQVLGNPVPDQENLITEGAKDFTLKFSVGLAPEFEVKADKSVHIPYYNIQVTDEMVTRQDEAMRRRYGKQLPGDEVDATALVKGVISELNPDGTLKEDGVVVENGIVAPQYFKSEEQKEIFMGKHLGDSVVFNPAATCDSNPTELSSMLNLSKEEAEEHKGDFRFDIKEIIVLKPAELGEEYYHEVFGSEVNDEAQYRDAVKKMIEAQLVGDQNYRFTVDAEKVIRNEVGELQLPDEILKKFLLNQNDSLNAENIDKEYDSIKGQLMWDLEKEKLMHELNVQVTNDDLRETARMMARQQFAQYGMQNVPADAIDKYAGQILEDEKAHASVVRQTSDMKLFNALKNAVTLDVKEVSVDEFNDLFRKEAEAANA